jgi:hypothetical protein
MNPILVFLQDTKKSLGKVNLQGRVFLLEEIISAKRNTNCVDLMYQYTLSLTIYTKNDL